MRYLLTVFCWLLVSVTGLAQQTDNYRDLRAKMLYVKEKYTGHATSNNQAAALVIQKLCSDFHGRLTVQQFKSITSEVDEMKVLTTDTEQRMLLERALQVLREKSDSLDIETRILDYYEKVPQEKIYVHTDKPYYVAGDTLWFRAHLVDAVTHTPISRSRYINIELLDNATDTLVQRAIIRCDSDGVFANALILPRNLHRGTYTLAAYTQWMRNFSAEHFFYKQISVVDSGDEVWLVPSAVSPESGMPADSLLQVNCRKDYVLIQPRAPQGMSRDQLCCVVYGSGNIITIEQIPAKPLRIETASLKTGNVCVVLLERQSGHVLAERTVFVNNGRHPDINITSKTGERNEPIEINIDVKNDDGTPLCGNFSLSVTDYDVVKRDTLQPDIVQYLQHQSENPTRYPINRMLQKQYAHIRYNFQTSQTISGRVKGTLFNEVKHPKLMLVRPDTGQRSVYELGDSSRFTLTGLDFADGTTYLLEGMRQKGSTRSVQLEIYPLDNPVLHIPATEKTQSMPLPKGFAKQAQEQVMYGSIDHYIELPDVIKEGKRLHKPVNRKKIEPYKALYADNSMLNKYATMEILLGYFGVKAYRDADGNYTVNNHLVRTLSAAPPVVYIDDFRSDWEELMSLQPYNIESIEVFKGGDSRLTVFDMNAPACGLIQVHLKAAYHFNGKPLSMATIKQQGWKPEMNFFSPQYTRNGSPTRPDHRTTLYWNPKVCTDSSGKASIKFYASDLSKRYLITLEGVAPNGTILRKQVVAY